jgi:hypothetical protein
MRELKPPIEAELEALERDSFSYFEHEVDPANGLVRDKTAQTWPASIAATGLALAEPEAWRRDSPAVPAAQTTAQKLPPHASSRRGSNEQPTEVVAAPARGPIASVIEATAPERESHAGSPKR